MMQVTKVWWDGEKLMAEPIDPAAIYKEPEQPEQQEPVAWRTFDGEGGYEYRSYDMNEQYAQEWEQRNPKHKGWVEPLYTAPAPCPTCEALARTVMLDQTSHDTPPPAQQEPGRNHWEDGDVFERIAAIKEQPAQQEPVAYLCEFYADPGHRGVSFEPVRYGTNTPLYTSPPAQRTWVGLTDEECGSMYNTHLRNGGPIQHFTRAIEAKLKEKNT